MAVFLPSAHTGNINIDRAIQVVVYGVGCGMSGSWWRNQHNKHHSMPQKLGHDVDLNTLPLVAFTEKVAKRLGMGLKMWIRLQAIMFPLLTTVLVALGWQYFLHIRHIIRVKNWSEMASIIARHAIWTALVTSQFGLAQSTLLFLAFDWVGSNYIFINFAVSHTHLDVVPKEDTQVRTGGGGALQTTAKV
jgi:fatty acid desaturase 2 (delta-6 desaturase)